MKRIVCMVLVWVVSGCVSAPKDVSLRTPAQALSSVDVLPGVMAEVNAVYMQMTLRIAAYADSHPAVANQAVLQKFKDAAYSATSNRVGAWSLSVSGGAITTGIMASGLFYSSARNGDSINGSTALMVDIGNESGVPISLLGGAMSGVGMLLLNAMPSFEEIKKMKADYLTEQEAGDKILSALVRDYALIFGLSPQGQQDLKTFFLNKQAELDQDQKVDPLDVLAESKLVPEPEVFFFRQWRADMLAQRDHKKGALTADGKSEGDIPLQAKLNVILAGRDLINVLLKEHRNTMSKDALAAYTEIVESANSLILKLNKL